MSNPRITFNSQGDYTYPPNELPSPLGYIGGSDRSTPSSSKPSVTEQKAQPVSQPEEAVATAAAAQEREIKDDSIIEQTERDSIIEPTVQEEIEGEVKQQ